MQAYVGEPRLQPHKKLSRNRDWSRSAELLSAVDQFEVNVPHAIGLIHVKIVFCQVHKR